MRAATTRFLGGMAAACLVLAAGCAPVSPVAAVRQPQVIDDALVRQFAPTGVLRAGINLGNPVIAQRDPAGGAPRGVGPDLAREMARRLGVPITYVTYEIAGKLADAAAQGAWDVAFLAVDPLRVEQMEFSAPYLRIEGTYLVRKDAPFAGIADLDRDGVRIAAGENAAYTLYLQRTLVHARVVTAPTSEAAVEMFRAQNLDAVAGVKNPLVAAAARDPSLRVVDGHFMVIDHGVAVPRGRPASLAWMRRVVEEAKADGFVERSLRASGVADATIAPGVH